MDNCKPVLNFIKKHVGSLLHKREKVMKIQGNLGWVGVEVSHSQIPIYSVSTFRGYAQILQESHRYLPVCTRSQTRIEHSSLDLHQHVEIPSGVKRTGEIIDFTSISYCWIHLMIIL
jgi:hypothetical protein